MSYFLEKRPCSPNSLKGRKGGSQMHTESENIWDYGFYDNFITTNTLDFGTKKIDPRTIKPRQPIQIGAPTGTEYEHRAKFLEFQDAPLIFKRRLLLPLTKDKNVEAEKYVLINIFALLSFSQKVHSKFSNVHNLSFV